MSQMYKWLIFHPVVIAFGFLAVCWAIATAIAGSSNQWHIHDIATAVGVVGGLTISKVAQYRYY
jgi:hypothetical protein